MSTTPDKVAAKLAKGSFRVNSHSKQHIVFSDKDNDTCIHMICIQVTQLDVQLKFHIFLKTQTVDAGKCL